MVKAMVIGTMLAMGSGSAFAQTPAKAKPDQKFVMEAAKGGMAEVELGKIAAEKGSSPEVKSFGQRMVDDHSRAGEELKTLAKNKSITLPPDIDANDKALRDRLLKLSGEGFDRAYMAAMLADHRKDVNVFRTEARSGKDPDVKTWAAKTLPTLTAHLKLAQSANKAVGTSGKK
jgi:putative membrane protein